MNTHWKKVFDSPYLGSQDLDDYKDINLTIEKAQIEMTKGLKENSEMNVIRFTDKSVKPMLLNATNSKAIKNLAKSPYLENWSGVEITVYVQQNVKAFGGFHDALRIRPVTNVIKKEELTPEHSKWEAAKKAKSSIEAIRKHYSITDENYKLLCK